HSRDIMFLENNTLKELEDIAKKYGLTSDTGLKKADLVVLINILVDSQAQTLLDFEDQNNSDADQSYECETKESKNLTNTEPNMKNEDKPAKKRGRPRGSKNKNDGLKSEDVFPNFDYAVQTDLKSEDIFPKFKDQMVRKESKDDIFPDFINEVPGSKGRRKRRIKLDPFAQAERILEKEFNSSDDSTSSNTNQKEIESVESNDKRSNESQKHTSESNRRGVISKNSQQREEAEQVGEKNHND